ncbi:hypothetical protein N0V88_003753 [Collariella sp. IMI 366227]|nr:hypothetical protein N0V88_003753 [Collariella sp. IMI 366227]
MTGRDPSLLSPSDYDADAMSIRSDQDTDSDDDERQLRARNSRELRAHDRLVLMEEEELDQLVTQSRKRQQLERRGSNLPIPNPLRMLTRRLSDASPREIEKPVGTAGRAKRNRLLAEAQHGEDGELMYEMEEGGMKDGSSTSENSDREDSDEVDRKHLLHITDLKAKRKRNCRCWLLFYAIVAVALAILVLVAWKLSIDRRTSRHTQNLVSNGTAMFAPTTLIISLDGFRADFLTRGLTPTLSGFIKDGVSPLYMHPSFPSVTFPNHYTIATGLYPEVHGIVGNSFWDPTLEAQFYYTDPKLSMDPKWWKGEPFWITAQKQGLKTAIHMWPGSEAHILSTEPTYMDTFNGREGLSNKVDRILSFLDMPDRDRPQIVAAYVPNVDSDGHKYGPNSTEIQFTIQKVDKMLGNIFKGLAERHLTNIVNVVIVSDHGMATTDTSRLIQLEDIVDLSRIEHTDGWPLVGLRPKNPDELQDIYNEVMQKTRGNSNVEVYLRDVDMPERYHFSTNKRIAPLWIIPKTGWAIVKMDEMNVKEAQAKGMVFRPRGLHGYDHEHPLMRAIFLARGPAFPHQPNSRVEPFQNIEVYNLLCDSVGITPAPNNGTLRLPLKPIGLHDDPGAQGIDTPVDPVEASPTSTVLSPDQSTRPVIVNPIPTTVVETTNAPTKPVGVDHPEPQPTTSPAQPPSSDTNNDGDDEDSAGDKVKEFWDWFTGKVEHWWDKVTGNGKEGGNDAGKSGEDGDSSR